MYAHRFLIFAGWAAKGGRGQLDLQASSRADAAKAVTDNKMWLDSCLAHILCVLALDRFGDYISDQASLCPPNSHFASVSTSVSKSYNDDTSFFKKHELAEWLFLRPIRAGQSMMESSSPRSNASSELPLVNNTARFLQATAPVRETAAQALGAASRACTAGQKQSILCSLSVMTKHQEWPVRQAGFLGLKYLLAAQQDAPHDLLPASFQMALAGLQVLLIPLPQSLSSLF